MATRPSGQRDARDFDERNVMECPAELLRLDRCELDHLAPLLDFVDDELAELGGRTRKHRAAQVREPRFHLWVGESGVDLSVELIDELGRGGLRCADAVPA